LPIKKSGELRKLEFGGLKSHFCCDLCIDLIEAIFADANDELIACESVKIVVNDDNEKLVRRRPCVVEGDGLEGRCSSSSSKCLLMSQYAIHPLFL
jgi:hypothetical protein